MRVGGSVEFDSLGSGRHVNLSRDGRWAVFQQRSLPSQPGSIMLLDLSRGGPPTRLVDSSGRQRTPRIAPGGELVAYVSDESGVDEVYLRRFPSADGLWQLSDSGGTWPIWSESGRRLFFRRRNAIYSVHVELDPDPLVSNPEVVFEYPQGVDYVTAHDEENERFLGVVAAETGSPVQHPLRLVENWLVEFER
jgi:hypothetical protein